MSGIDSDALVVLIVMNTGTAVVIRPLVVLLRILLVLCYTSSVRAVLIRILCVLCLYEYYE